MPQKNIYTLEDLFSPFLKSYIVRTKMEKIIAFV